MIQRIQTVYLLLIVVLAVINLFLPLAVFQQGNELLRFDVSGLMTMEGVKEMVYPTWGLMGLVAAIALVAFATIFLYKRRMLQIRLCIFNMLLMIGFYAYFGFLVWKIKDGIDVSVSVRFALCLPFVSMILNYLAIRNIGADEALVRSLERLR